MSELGGKRAREEKNFPRTQTFILLGRTIIFEDCIRFSGRRRKRFCLGKKRVRSSRAFFWTKSPKWRAFLNSSRANPNSRRSEG